MAHKPHHFQPRDKIELDQVAFARLADLAYRADPRRGLAKQMSFHNGVSERGNDRWLTGDSPPPIDQIEAMIPLAEKGLEQAARAIAEARARLAEYYAAKAGH